MRRKNVNPSGVVELEALFALYAQTEEVAHRGSWRAHLGPESVLELSSEARKILGFAPGARVRNLDLFNALHVDDREKLLETIIKVRSESVRADVVVRVVSNQGKERLVLVDAAPPPEPAEPGVVIGTVQDVSDRSSGSLENERRTASKSELRQAVRADQLFLEYQPIMSFRERRVVGAEALVRWQHPERGRLEPGDFIGLAEDSGVIVPLGQWVLERACQELRRWREAGVGRDFTLSVNLSAAQLWRAGFATEFAQAVDNAGVPWSSIVLEVSESILVERVIEQTLRTVRERGVQIAIDDFGTKYSALGELPRLPVDALKIDARFVHDIDSGAGPAVVHAITALGRALGLTVIAEGVESPRQLAVVREVGCDAAQGFIISPPLDPEGCLKLALASEGRRASGR